MRIIAGSKARMTLLPPRDRTTRPITDRVKESLFNIISPVINESYVADLFCGTGSLGLEALSRGAKHAIMVDRDKDALDRLRKNIAKLKLESQTTVVQTNAFKSAVPTPLISSSPTPSDSICPCDIVFVDPPYKLSEDTSPESPLGVLLKKLDTQVTNNALVIVRHEKPTQLLDTYGYLTITDIRSYGYMTITFLEKQSA